MPLVTKPAGNTPSPQHENAEVLRALAGGNREERWAAARAAAYVTGGAEALAAALHTEADPHIREAMLTSLAKIGSAQSVEAIISLLRRDDASLRTGALDALRTMPLAVSEYLPALLHDSDSDVRVLSCELARGLPAAEATPLLCSLLAREAEPNVCAAAIDVLAEVGNMQALPALDQCAERFAGIPFLEFAIRIARGRVSGSAGQNV